MANPALTHLALHVANLDASLHFYVEWAGMHLVYRREEEQTKFDVAWLTSQQPGQEMGFVIVLIAGGLGMLFGGSRPQQPLGPMSHLGFSASNREQVDAIAHRAEVAGILLRPAAYVNKVVGYICVVRDPDGHSVEFSVGQDFA